MNDNGFSYADFTAANHDKTVSGYDYLCNVSQSQKLPPDYFYWMAKLYRPDFIVIDGIVFVKEIFDAGNYEELILAGESVKNIQFWLNLLEITGMFPMLSMTQAESVAQAVSATWNDKIKLEFGDGMGLSRVILDSATDEVFVVIGEHEDH